MVEDSYIEQLCKEGDLNQAFNIVVRQYSKRLYWHIREMVASHEDTDDLLQNTFIKVWKGLPNFRFESNLYTWLYRIATNESLTFLNRDHSADNISMTSLENFIANRFTTERDLSGDTIQSLLQKEIMKLPDKQRAIFSLRYFQDLDYKEIAEIVNSTPDAAKASYSIAYKKIEEALKKVF